jgi:hypothetical protein
VHAAPPVRVSLGRSIGWVAVVATCAGVAVANVTAWLLLQSEAAAAPAALSGLAVAALVSWRLHRAHAPGELNWNGSEWQWQGVDGQVQVALDLDAWMLLRFDPTQGRRRWIAASRASTRGPWSALRAALYARRPADPLAP